MAKGYCTHADVAAFLQQSLTAAQQAWADVLIEAIEPLIDEGTNRGWLVGDQAGERHELKEYWRGELYLRYTPVATLTSLTGRTCLGGDEITLVADTDYEVVNLAEGHVRLVCPQTYDRLLASYSPVAAVPAPIRVAAAEWVAARLLPALRPDTYGIDSFTLPDLSVRFSAAVTGDVPPNVQSTLDLYRYVPVN